MKNSVNRLYPTYAAAFVLLFTAACSKDKADPIPSSTWKVDGQEQSTSTVLAHSQNNLLQLEIWQQFTSSTSNGSSIVFSLNVPQQVGTYDLAGASPRATASYSDLVNNGLYLGTQGSITVSSLANGYATGSFTFTGTGSNNPQLTKSITAGKFTSKLP